MPGSDDYGPLYDRAGQQYNIDPQLLRAIVSVESNGDPNAVGPQTKYGQAQGLGQLIPQTAKSLGVTDPTDPKQSIFGAAKLLDENLKRYSDPEKAILAYHGGTDPANWGPKTQAYLQKVKSAYQGRNVADDPFSRLMATVPSAEDEAGAATVPGDGTAMPVADAAGAPDVAASDPFSRLMATVDQGRSESPATAPGAKGVVSVKRATAAELAKLASAPAAAASAAPGEAAASGPEGNASALLRMQQEHGYQPTALDKALTAFEDFTEQAKRAASFGLTDKVGALVPAVNNLVAQAFGQGPSIRDLIANDGNAPSFSDIYHNNLAQQRGYGDTYAQNHPTASPVATTIGTIGSLGAGAGASVPLTIGGKLAQGATTGAGLGAISGFGNSNDESVGQTLQDTGRGTAIGLAAGAALPVVAKGIGATANALTGGGVSQAVADLARKAGGFGIPLRAGQISSSPFIKYADSFFSKMPFTGYAAKDEQAREAFTRAVSKTFGEDSPALTQDVMANARTRIGNVFNQVAKNTTIKADNQLLGDLAKVESESSQILPDSEFKPIRNQLNNLFSKVGPDDTISGETYQAFTRKGAPLDRAMGSKDPNIRSAASDIRNALDDALERSASPEDVNALRGARLQWKNMRTVQDLAAKANIEGEISPGALLGAVKKSYKDLPYSGAGQIGDLANIGQRFLKEQPSSGTGERIAILDMLRHHPSIGGAIGALEGVGVYENPLMALAGTGGLLGTTAIAARVLNNPLYRAMLLRSGQGPGPVNRLFSAAVHRGQQLAIPSMVNNNLLFANPNHARSAGSPE